MTASASALPAPSSASQCVTNVGPVVQYVPSVLPLYWSDKLRGVFRPSSPFSGRGLQKEHVCRRKSELQCCSCS